MNRSTYFGWLFLAVWAAWLGALSGHMAQFGWSGRWTPDLATALFVALAARVPMSDIAKLAVCFGVARVSVSIDAPAAVLAAALSTGALLRLARSAVQLDSPVIASLLAFVLCLAQAAWLELAHVRTQAVLPPEWGGVNVAWRCALSTAFATAVLGGVLANLPGLGSLLRRKAWAVGASDL